MKMVERIFLLFLSIVVTKNYAKNLKTKRFAFRA
ncbi:hypothetical protein HID58_006311 [Brassica napus]|uniref:Uncharacterized protein n=1 Tax=Brassica napus TaxID=3708 RepID=A0ABQ8EB80_BRANA|nr:hypothetical protein HID58_006311 [Brassica napus]